MNCIVIVLFALLSAKARYQIHITISILPVTIHSRYISGFAELGQVFL